MKIFIKLTVLLVILGSSMPGMNQNVFHKTFGGNGNEIFTKMIHQSGENYIISGLTSSFTPGMYHLFLSEINTAGQLMWLKTYGFVSSVWDYDFIKTSDGSYVIACSYIMNNQVLLIKTNQTGDTIWTRSHSLPLQLNVSAVLQSFDGGFYICANVYDANSTIVLMKTDSAGNMLWANHYQHTGSISSKDIALTDDGGIAVLGEVSTFQVLREMLLLRLDSSGNVFSANQYGQNNSNYEFASSIIRTSDGGYILAGFNWKPQQNNTSGVYLVKINSVFDTLWTRTLYDSFYDINYHGSTLIVQTDDDGFIISGSSGTQMVAAQMFDSSGIFLVKTDSLGFPLWSKRFGEFHTGVGETAGDVFPTSDKGFVIAGNTSGTGTFVPYYHDVYLIKTDSLGNTNNCVEIPSSYVPFALNTVVMPLSVSATALTSTSLTPAIIVNTQIFQDSLLCVLVNMPEDDKKNSEILCYPNPFSDYSIIQYHSSMNKDVRVLVYDLTGRHVSETECRDGKCTLERGNMKSGMYVFRIMNDDHIIGSGKIIVE